MHGRKKENAGAHYLLKQNGNKHRIWNKFNQDIWAYKYNSNIYSIFFMQVHGRNKICK